MGKGCAMSTATLPHRRARSVTPTPPSAATAGYRRGPWTWLVLAIFVLITQAAGLVGVPFTDTGPGTWYGRLDKPSFTPPGWVVAPVWTLLYLSIAVAAWRVWRRPGSAARTRALGRYTGQLVLNALWTPIFFGAHQPAWAFATIVVLLVVALATVADFDRVDRTAALLFVPYLLWVKFATLLNAAIVVLN